MRAKSLDSCLAYIITANLKLLSNFLCHRITLLQSTQLPGCTSQNWFCLRTEFPLYYCAIIFFRGLALMPSIDSFKFFPSSEGLQLYPSTKRHAKNLIKRLFLPCQCNCFLKNLNSKEISRFFRVCLVLMGNHCQPKGQISAALKRVN